MSDTPHERNSNSKSNLIEVQHVGVTAKLQSPLKNLLQSPMSSTETENGQLLFHDHHGHKMKYSKFSNDTQAETETESQSKVLYEMHAVRDASTRHPGKRNATPSKIEFQLYKTATRRMRRSKSTPGSVMKCCSEQKKSKRKLFAEPQRASKSATTTHHCTCHAQQQGASDNTIFKRLRHSLDNMRAARTNISKPKTPKCNQIFVDLPECGKAAAGEDKQQSPSRARDITPPPRETRIGIYPFEHGCAEYLRTTDCHPQLLSVVLAERATYYATRFWAEFFGSLHIGVTFVVTFVLQAYRFVLYSLVNTLVVGFLHMTSDYLIKPILTVIFNGFLQPPLILVYNILTSLRDILEPVADTINNFMRPVATVGKSLRLVHASYNTRKLEKEV